MVEEMKIDDVPVRCVVVVHMQLSLSEQVVVDEEEEEEDEIFDVALVQNQWYTLHAFGVDKQYMDEVELVDIEGGIDWGGIVVVEVVDEVVDEVVEEVVDGVVEEVVEVVVDEVVDEEVVENKKVVEVLIDIENEKVVENKKVVEEIDSLSKDIVA